MQSVTNIAQLRELLAERFPNARMISPDAGRKTINSWPTGLPQLDELLDGGIAKGRITELTAGAASCGSGLLLRAFLRRTAANREWFALVDGRDSFDPAPVSNTDLSRVLWVRCVDGGQAVKAADFILRDGNLPVVALDLRMTSLLQLRRISATAWYRLQRCIEANGTAFLVITPYAIVAAADVRVELQTRFTLSALTQPEDALVSQLQFRMLRTHGMQQNGREPLAEAG